MEKRNYIHVEDMEEDAVVVKEVHGMLQECFQNIILNHLILLLGSI